MRSNHPQKALWLVALTGGALATTSASADTSGGYSTAIFKSGSQSVQATLGTHSFPNADGSFDNAQATYPLKTTATLKIRSGKTIAVLLGHVGSDVRWRLSRVSNGQEVLVHGGVARPTTKTYKRWKITLPKKLRKSEIVLGVDVSYPNGFSSFETGARVLS
jgi:hypothetical protein